jgi:hypothetical protein
MPLIMRPGLMGPRVGRPGLLGLAARTAFVADTAGAGGGAIPPHQEEKAEAQAYESAPVEAAPAAPAPVAAPAAAVSDTDRRLEQLKELAALRSQGVLTDAEFATQKAAVLNSR